ncbi:MAG: class IV adenylate cyclase, partial [Anaerolineales bacterium]
MEPTTEVEAKFMLPHLADMRHSVLSLGGHLISPRILERNLRLDDQAGSLQAEGKVLRLRQDRDIRLTYKEKLGRFETRLEIEIEVDDFDQTLNLLQALGYTPIMVYEKYRQVFNLMEASIMMDELPFGCFVEIEAVTLDQVRVVAEKLGLVWGKRVQSTYMALFDRLRTQRGLKFKDATFANFEGLPTASSDELNVSYGSK